MTAHDPRPTARLDFARARDLVRQLVPETPLVLDPELSEHVGAPVHLKLENRQETGSFKVRGAAARILSLSASQRRAGVVACSSGNHGRAVAWVAERLGVAAVVCVPRWIDPVKLDAIRGHGAEAVLAGDTYDEAEREAERLARSRGLTAVHPFDDPWVVAGQGTIALEILDALPDVGTVVAPLSGGGLVGGIARALADHGPRVRVLAASAQRARVMVESLRAGRPVELPEETTLASALSGGIGLDNRVTFALVRDHVHAHDVVPEDEIGRAMADAWRRLGITVEGGGAVALAAVRRGGPALAAAGPLAVVVSGGNVAPATMERVLADHVVPPP